MNLKDMIKLTQKRNKFIFLSEEERDKEFIFPGECGKPLKNIVAYMTYGNRCYSYNDISAAIKKRKWIKEKGWRLPTKKELISLMLLNPTYFHYSRNGDCGYISSDFTTDGKMVIIVGEDWYIRHPTSDMTTFNFKYNKFIVLVTEKEF